MGDSDQKYRINSLWLGNKFDIIPGKTQGKLWCRHVCEPKERRIKFQSRTKIIRQMLNSPIPFQFPPPSPLSPYSHYFDARFNCKRGQASLRHTTTNVVLGEEREPTQTDCKHICTISAVSLFFVRDCGHILRKMTAKCCKKYH